MKGLEADFILRAVGTMKACKQGSDTFALSWTRESENWDRCRCLGHGEGCGPQGGDLGSRSDSSTGWL